MSTPLLARIRQLEEEAKATEPQMPDRPSPFDYFPSIERVYAGRKWEYRVAHREWATSLDAKIEAIVAEEYGLTDHPKRRRLWELAWDYGHAAGIHEVLIHYDSLSTLLQEDV